MEAIIEFLRATGELAAGVAALATAIVAARRRRPRQ